MADLAPEQIADQILAERKLRQCETRFSMEHRSVFHIPPFPCARCGADHQRYRDAAHTKAAAWCATCHAAYVRERRQRRMAVP